MLFTHKESSQLIFHFKDYILDREFLYVTSEPSFSVHTLPSKMLGNCYTAYYAEVISQFKLNAEQLRSLSKSGIILCGDEFYVRSVCDGTEEPFKFETLQCVEHINGKPQPGPAVIPYSGEPYEPITKPYYKYLVESRVDSSD